MKKMFLLAAAWLAGVMGVGAQGSNEATSGMYPLTFAMFSGDGFLPVVGGRAQQARVRVGNGVSLARSDAPIMLLRSARFAKGRATVTFPTDEAATARGQGANGAITRPDLKELVVNVRGEGLDERAQCYAVAILWNADGNVRFAYADLGRLPDGRDVPARFFMPFLEPSSWQQFGVVIVSIGEGEVLTNIREGLTPKLAETDQKFFVALRQNYLESRRNETSEPLSFNSPPPVFPSSRSSEAVDVTVDVTFDVNLDGYVENVRTEGTPPVDFSAAATNAIRLWRFLPAVENGRAVMRTMRLPLRFRNDPNGTEGSAIEPGEAQTAPTP